jgi:hypothetical protein
LHAVTLCWPLGQAATLAIEQSGTATALSQSSVEQTQELVSAEKQHFWVPVGAGHVAAVVPVVTFIATENAVPHSQSWAAGLFLQT